MVLWDVNLLLYAAIPTSPHHARCRSLLLALLGGEEHFAISEFVLASFVRICTNPKAFDPPALPREALAFCQSLLSHPLAVKVAPGPRHWRIFEDLVLAAGVRGSDIADAHLAALAIEHGCSWWSSDRDFARFGGLRWHDPLLDAVSVHEP